MSRMIRTDVQIDAGPVILDGILTMPEGACGFVVFAHGSGSGRYSRRNRFVATYLNDRGFGTLLFDLLSEEEAMFDESTAELRFDIGLLAMRLTAAVDFIIEHVQLTQMGLGLFGASTGAAAALTTAARRPELLRAVVSRGGRPDLAGPDLSRVRAPTLFIVGALDEPVIRLNAEAAAHLRVRHELQVVPRATHLFEQPGTLDTVATLAADWFLSSLPRKKLTATPRSELR